MSNGCSTSGEEQGVTSQLSDSRSHYESQEENRTPMTSSLSYNVPCSQDIVDGSQSQLTQTQPLELTQLCDLDENDESNFTQESPLSSSPPHAPINLLKIPWGRLVGCRTNGVGFELLPRPPNESIGSATRSKTLSQQQLLSSRDGFEGENCNTFGISFLGLKHLKLSDRFNEYVVGRSIKCDIVVPRRSNIEQDAESLKLDNRIHSMISGLHFRIFCILKGPTSMGEMEVYLEDSSANGTCINGTLLRRNQRRILHNGDNICLLNPVIVQKEAKGQFEQKQIIDNYSFLFLHDYQTQRGLRLKAAPKAASFMENPVRRKRGLVDVRLLNIHSHQREKITFPPNKRIKTTHEKAQTGRQFEAHYDLRNEIGFGTCGQVRKAVHRKTGKMVAVKIIAIKGKNAMDSSIQTEYTILQTLKHPYIVELFDVFIDPGKSVYLVMELMEGGDLFDRIIARQKFSEVNSRRVMRRMLAAVYHLHVERGIVHRDLKPENVLCVSKADDINVKLTDFGLAKSIAVEECKTFCGTPQYFAPEVLSRRHTVAGIGRYSGKEADMWSLGVILYILLSGRPPFDHSKGMDAINDGISFSGNAWSEISSDATDLIASLLEKNPKQRISIADACSHPWILTKDGDSHEHPLGDPVLLIQDGKRREKFKDDNTSSHTPNIRIRNPQRLNEKNDKSILKGQCSSPSQNANLPTPPNRNLVAAKSNPSWKRNSLLTVVKQLSNGSNGGSVEKEESGKERKNLEHEDSFVGSQSSEVIINETQDDQIGSGNGITEAQVSVKSAPACGQSQLNNLGSAAKSQGKKKTALGVLLEDQALKEGEKTGKPGTQSRDSLKGKQATLSKWILKE